MLYEKWQTEIKSTLAAELKIKNKMAIPKVNKVIVHMGLAAERDDQALLSQFVDDMMAITGQKPKVCKSKKAVSGFKLRKGEVVGLMVTLRGRRMYDFLEKLFAVILPRLRDFRGLPESKFDAAGNYSFGVSEQLVFPEILIEKVKKVKGLQVTITTTARDRETGIKLLSMLGLPFAGQRV